MDAGHLRKVLKQVWEINQIDTNSTLFWSSFWLRHFFPSDSGISILYLTRSWV